jgi:threonine dehydrogenase-like Zn-dependent dehydrogenase
MYGKGIVGNIFIIQLQEKESKEMKGIVFLGDGALELRDFDIPVPGPGEVLVEMKASGICGSDLNWLNRTKKEIDALPHVNPMGHEPCGVIASLGPGVTDVAVGQRVMVYHYSGCGRCKYCRIGYEQLCIHGFDYYGTSRPRGFGGGHEDYMVVPGRVCLNLPDGMSFEAGTAVACGTGTAYAALKKVAAAGHDTIAVFGQGPVGLSATMIGAALGARVIAIDRVPYRLELAKKLGAAEVVNASDMDAVEAVKHLTGGEGAEVALECVANPSVRVQAVESAKVFGRVCFLGEGGGVSFEDVSRQIMHKLLTIHGSWTFPTWMLEEAADWIIGRNLPIEDLITHRFTLEEAREAYRIFQEGQTGKVVFSWR